MCIRDRCNTGMGKRFFKEQLLHPISNIYELNGRYNKTELMLRNKGWNICADLNKIKDIERLTRKAITSKLHPHQLSCLYTSIIISYENFQKLIEYPEINDVFFADMDQHHYESFLTHCNSQLNFNELDKYNLDTIKTNIFKDGVHPILDDMYDRIKQSKENFNNLISKASDGWLKIEYNDRDGYYFSITNKRWTQLKSENHIITTELKQFGSTSNQIKLTSAYIQSENKVIQDLEIKTKALSLELYNDFIVKLMNVFNDTLFKPYIEKLQEIDFHICCAKNAVDFNLSRPIIQESKESFFEFDAVRHPIVEHVQRNIQYTSNSLSLGIHHLGLILYGVNASGKSSFMKSIGVNLILAQSGMFVSCAKLTYYPYKQLFTRILSSDNIVKGMSTFANEIYEIRNILKKADTHSVVIGDELCSGTESVSAIAIVMSGILSLIKSKTTFIFATHLHELNNLKRLKDQTKILIKHLKVTYDEHKDRLIYDRKLFEGPGSSLYGLEVCKAMDMDKEFIHNASLIRHELVHASGNITTSQRSRYNQDVIMDCCKICQSRKGIETHHIKFQKSADRNGMVENTFHKNKTHNLVVLCDKCHDKVHKNELDIYGWIQTSDGVTLEHNENSTSTIDIDFICNTRKANTFKHTMNILRNNDIHLSEYKVRKIIKENI